MEFNVALTLKLDWENLSADRTLIDIFDRVDLDCYGRTAVDGTKCWILQGTCSNIENFTNRLSFIVSNFDIIALSFGSNIR